MHRFSSIRSDFWKYVQQNDETRFMAYAITHKCRFLFGVASFGLGIFDSVVCRILALVPYKMLITHATLLFNMLLKNLYCPWCCLVWKMCHLSKLFSLLVDDNKCTLNMTKMKMWGLSRINDECSWKKFEQVLSYLKQRALCVCAHNRI